MKIINHPLCTTSIGAPSDMQDDCSALPVAYRTDEHGTWAVSFWKPDAAELATLNGEGCITLQVRAAGRQHPVVAMGTYPMMETTAHQDATSGAELQEEISWCIEHGTADARVEACLLRCRAEIPLRGAAPPENTFIPVGALAWAWALVTPSGNVRFWSRNRSTVERMQISCPNEVLQPILYVRALPANQARVAIAAALAKSRIDKLRAEFARMVVQSVSEIPDRDSPEDQPEMMLVTGPELTNIIASAFESDDEATTLAGGALPNAQDEQTAAARDVLAERRRQISHEGYDHAHDDEHPSGEIAARAAFYAMPPAARDWTAEGFDYGNTFGEAIWPERWSMPKTADRRRELVKAGALILAEIERIDRAIKPQDTP